MDAIANPLPTDPRPTPRVDEVWAAGIRLYRLSGKRGSGVYILPDRSCWWVEWNRTTHRWDVIDRDTMDD